MVSIAVHLYHGTRRIVCIALALVRLVPGVRECVATGGDGSNARVVEHLYAQQQGAAEERGIASRAPLVGVIVGAGRGCYAIERAMG